MIAAPKNRWVQYGLRLALTVVILVGLVAIADVDTLGSVLGRVGLGAFVLATLLHIAGSIVVPAVVSHRSIHGTPLDLSLRQLVLINFSIRFYTMVLPRATATGVRWVKYRSAGGGSHAAALVVLEKLVQVFVYSVIAIIFMIVDFGRFGGEFVPLLLVPLGAAVATGIGLIAVFTARLDPLLSRWTLTRRMPAVDRRLGQIASAVKSQRGRSITEAAALGGWSTLGFIFFVASAWIVVRDLNILLPLVGLIWIRGVVFLGTLFPLTIAGAGVREAGFVGFTHFYGIDSATALGLALSLLGLQIAIGAVGGLVELTGQFGFWRNHAVESKEKVHADV